MSNPYTIIALTASDLPWLYGRPRATKCRRCSCETGYLARYIKVNGAVSIRWVCDWCEDYSTASDLPKSVLANHGVTPSELPIRRDRRDEYVANECVVCRQDAVEFHHWAPRAIFPHWNRETVYWEDGNVVAYEDWDTDLLGVWLCLDHHHEWHARMRAHGLRWPHEITSDTW